MPADSDMYYSDSHVYKIGEPSECELSFQASVKGKLSFQVRV